jgi:hypothetical protein
MKGVMKGQEGVMKDQEGVVKDQEGVTEGKRVSWRDQEGVIKGQEGVTVFFTIILTKSYLHRNILVQEPLKNSNDIQLRHFVENQRLPKLARAPVIDKFFININRITHRKNNSQNVGIPKR